MSAGTFGRAEAPARASSGGAVRGNTKSAVALGLDLVGLAGAFFVFPPVVFSTLAIILGAMGRSEARQDPVRGGETMGVTAIVLGILGFVVAVAWTIIAG